MPRKRRLDLRDFWLWYERHSSIRDDLLASQQPPFQLRDIAQNPPRYGRPWVVGFWVVVGVVVACVIWAIVH